MLRYELTPNNAGFILWGDSEALNELHELIPEQRKKQLISIVRSFHSLWGKYAREKQDIKMLNEMNNTSWVWPDNINW